MGTLLNEYCGLARLDRAHVHDVLKVPGPGPAELAQIKADFRLSKLVCAGKSAAVSFESWQSIADYFYPRFTGKRQAIVVGVLLNVQKTNSPPCKCSTPARAPSSSRSKTCAS
jgi:DNA repair protein RadC